MSATNFVRGRTFRVSFSRVVPYKISRIRINIPPTLRDFEVLEFELTLMPTQFHSDICIKDTESEEQQL